VNADPNAATLLFSLEREKDYAKDGSRIALLSIIGVGGIRAFQNVHGLDDLNYFVVRSNWTLKSSVRELGVEMVTPRANSLEAERSTLTAYEAG